MNFDEEHIKLIDEYAETASEIEKAIFTRRYKLTKKHFAIFSVQTISMLYSLWEGYVQKSFQMYLDYINRQNIQYDSLCDSMKIYYMENTFKQFKDYPSKPSKKISFFNGLQKHFILPRHMFPTVVNTQSNVDFDVLNGLMESLSLQPFPERWKEKKYDYPNPTLKAMMRDFLRYRNGVAHGGDISNEEKITKEVYSKYRLLVTDLMYSIHLRMLDGIQNKTYLRPHD